MGSLRERYIELLGQKLKALNLMLEVTQNEVFTGNDDLAEREAEAFVTLYGRRTSILSDIEKIDDAIELLEPLDAQDIEEPEFQEQIVGFREKMKAIAKEMLELDKANMAAYEKISTFFKGNMKHVRQTKDLNNRYIDNLDAFTDGHLLDKRN